MKWVPSPNFNERKDAITYVVLHYTGMTDAAAALAKLCDPTAQVSAHYLIEENGELIQLVREEDRAWHAGKSFWRGARDLNSLSIGIELVNPGHALGYRPFPEAQIECLESLLDELFTRYALPPEALLAHSDIAPNRKTDPGEFFPWERLAAKGFGLWPKEGSTPPFPRRDIGELLSAIGYDITDIEAAMTAFALHYDTKSLDELGGGDPFVRALQKRAEALCDVGKFIA